ncbi:MAG: pre-peptidase C-terminal domain-containing protein [Anaerolineae bacterium]|nr:pre-peptidase C-terminal domain-containing protein [Anaerolineae bacterium]
MIMMDRKRYVHRFYRLGWSACLSVMALALSLGLVASPATTFAQGNTGRAISVGDVVTGSLSAENFAQVYTLAASAGDTITIDVTTEVAELALVVVVTNAQGSVIVQDLDRATPTTASIADIEVPVSGTYYIWVMRGSGAEGNASGDFTLQLSGIQQVGGQTVTLGSGGIVVELGWNAAVDLNLEVRDPVGGTAHRFRPGTPSGGVLDADINANCDAAIATNPTETIAWPAGTVPAGSYEIITYYSNVCSTGGPQLFTLNTTVNGETAQTLTGTLNPGQEYLARLELDTNGEWTLVNGGVNAGLDLAAYAAEIGTADPIAVGSTVSGIVTNRVPVQAYSFNGSAGTSITVDMRAQSGSLDPFLILLGPDNTPLDSNDDASSDSADARISRNLVVEGTYTVLAARYGLGIGGTEGEFTLTLTAAEPAEDAGTITPEATATVEGGLPSGAVEVKLEWATNADMQLLVRDPNGDSVYDDIPVVQSGGILEMDGNVGCLEPTTSPVSYIYWPPNRLLPGVYEIEVWYQNTCDDTTPVNFGLSVNVQGQSVINTSQPASPDSRYVITFTVAPDGTVVAGPGGFFSMANASTLNYQTALASATPLAYGQTVSGSITDQRRFVLYSFEGQQGDIVTIGMNATGGTLDTAVYLISPEGIQVAYNDDATPGENRNSVIAKATLASSGTYYIIATHYGLSFGGTQGTYTLTLVQD